MSSQLETLLSYFPSGTAEGEKFILDQVFVYANEFKRIISPPIGSPHLLIGNKGTGKSALLNFTKDVLKKGNAPALLLTPSDIDTTRLPDGASIGDMKRFFVDALIDSISSRLAESGVGVLSGEQAAVYARARSSGGISAPSIIRIGRFLEEIARPIHKASISSAFNELSSATRGEIITAIKNLVERESFYLFLDDTDQIANPDKSGHLNRIWALILAVRSLASDIPQLRAVVTLRSEVWERLRRDDTGVRDQTDHFLPLIVRMHTSPEHVQRIVERRLERASYSLGLSGNYYEPFFEGKGALQPGRGGFRGWKDLIEKRSRDRPRDAIQLVRRMADYAASAGKQKIDEHSFHAVMPDFSRDVAEGLAQEVSKECPVMLDVIRSFADLDYDMGTFIVGAERAKSHFEKVMSRFGVVLYGRALNQADVNSPFEMWRFCSATGFLNARVSDVAQRDGYRHLSWDVASQLVSRSRWNDMQAHLWEVNTAYRDYLQELQAEKAARIGLPTKQARNQVRKDRRTRR